MGVVGGQTKLIFCEGEWEPDQPKSLDERLLNRLLSGKPPTVVIEPAGGKFQLRAFIQGRLAAQRALRPLPSYLAFRDRDFDAQPTPIVSLIPYRSGQPIFMSHRSAIENYLIDVALLHQYWNAHSNAPSWKHGPSPGENDLRTWVDEAARQLIAYEAVRWALASLKKSDRWPELRTTWTKGSGHLPVSLVESDCLLEAKRVVAEFQIEAQAVNEGDLQEKYRHFRDQFSDVGFWNDGKHLVWFHGKDLKKQMQKLKPTAISLDHYCSWAVENLDWQKHDDLKELANKMAS